MSENKITYIENAVLGEGYYSIEHKSGLRIFVYPKEEYTSTYAVFGTKYGSIDTRFKRSDKTDFIEIPAGTAHFLEHKLFESEELDAFQRYAKTGASAKMLLFHYFHRIRSTAVNTFPSRSYRSVVRYSNPSFFCSAAEAVLKS